MAEKVYTNPEMDRSNWGPGPWDGEPDKVSWTDEETGLPCLAVRPVPHLGNWCGYVAVEPGHPWHGKGYEVPDVEVHGGLTFAASCDDDAPVEGAVCHMPEPGRPADVWWFGFDCGHFNDISPAMVANCPELTAIYDHAEGLFKPVYRPLAYVKAECRSLAAQLAAVAESSV